MLSTTGQDFSWDPNSVSRKTRFDSKEVTRREKRERREGGVSDTGSSNNEESFTNQVLTLEAYSCLDFSAAWLLVSLLSSCFLIAFRQLLLDFEDTLFYALLSTPSVFQALCLLVLRQNFVRVSLEIILILERFVSIILCISLIHGNKVFLCHLKEYPVQPLVCQDPGPRVDPQP